MPSVTHAIPTVTLYTRDDCSLCDESRGVLDALLAERREAGLRTFEIVERDIASDPELVERFGAVIPVVEVGDRRVELAVSVSRLRRLLADALGDRAPTTTPR